MPRPKIYKLICEQCGNISCVYMKHAPNDIEPVVCGFCQSSRLIVMYIDDGMWKVGQACKVHDERSVHNFYIGTIQNMKKDLIQLVFNDNRTEWIDRDKLENIEVNDE